MLTALPKISLAFRFRIIIEYGKHLRYDTITLYFIHFSPLSLKGEVY